MDSEKEPPISEQKSATPLPSTAITNALKQMNDNKSTKISIEKVFVLNEPCFVKELNPVSGNVIQIQNSKKFVINKPNPPIEKKNEPTTTTVSPAIKSKPTESSVQLGLHNSKRIIINNASSITDVKVLQRLIASLAGAKAPKNVVLKSVSDGKSFIIQNDQLNSTDSDKKNEPANDKSANKKAIQPTKDNDKEIVAVQNGPSKKNDEETDDVPILSALKLTKNVTLTRTTPVLEKNSVKTLTTPSRSVPVVEMNSVKTLATPNRSTPIVEKNSVKTLATPISTPIVDKNSVRTLVTPTRSTLGVAKNSAKTLVTPTRSTIVVEKDSVRSLDTSKTNKSSKIIDVFEPNAVKSSSTCTDKNPPKTTVNKSIDAENNKIQTPNSSAQNIKESPTIESPAKHPEKMFKRKKYMYKLKGKNGRVLNYVSDTPIVLKKPVIRLDKMTEADAQRLSKQFAKESKKKSRKTIDPHNRKVYPTRSSLSTKKSETSPTEDVSTSLTSGIQTRKRQLKFLPDGRIKRGRKKTRRPSLSSTSFSSSSDEDRKVDTSDENYSDSSTKKRGRKKASENKKLITENKVVATFDVAKTTGVANTTDVAKTTNRTNKNIPHNQTPKAQQPSPVKSAKEIASPAESKIPAQPVAQKNSHIHPAEILSSLIGVPISSNQLTVNRFKPKNLKPRDPATTTFTTKTIMVKISSNAVNSSEPIVLNTTPTNTFKLAPKVLSSEPPPLSPLTPARPRIATPSQWLTRPIIPANKVAAESIKKDSLHDIFKTFEGFTDTKIVKTKQGPKKLIFDKLNENDTSRTIYDVMDDVFEALPSWNIHVIPDTKTFCLAQISRSRTGVPALKKSIEINSEFVAKVYVHQLHCKRYDGVYDTESKIKKLIRDIDALIV